MNVLHRKITAVDYEVGGTSRFLGLQLDGQEWLIVALPDAAHWFEVTHESGGGFWGPMLYFTRQHGNPEDGITRFELGPDHLDIENGVVLYAIRAKDDERSPFGWSRAFHHFGPTDDLRQKVFLSPTTKLRLVDNTPSRAEAVDRVYADIDWMLLENRALDESRKYLLDLCLPETPVPVLLSALTGTLPWADLLVAERAKVAAQVRSLRPSNAEELLLGLVRKGE